MDVPYDVRRVDHRVAASRDYAKVEQRTGWEKRKKSETRRLWRNANKTRKTERSERDSLGKWKCLANGNAWQKPDMLIF